MAMGTIITDGKNNAVVRIGLTQIQSRHCDDVT